MNKQSKLILLLYLTAQIVVVLVVEEGSVLRKAYWFLLWSQIAVWDLIDPDVWLEGRPVEHGPQSRTLSPATTERADQSERS